MERLRLDAARPMSVNLAEGIALSHKLLRFAGAAVATAEKLSQPSFDELLRRLVAADIRSF